MKQLSLSNYNATKKSCRCRGAAPEVHSVENLSHISEHKIIYLEQNDP